MLSTCNQVVLGLNPTACCVFDQHFFAKFKLTGGYSNSQFIYTLYYFVKNFGDKKVW